MLALNANWEAEFAGDVEPVHLVRIHVGRKAFLTVADFTLGSGATVSIARNGGAAVTLTEGIDFNADTSNAQTAANIVEGFLNSFAFTDGSYQDVVNVWSEGALITATVAVGDTVTFSTSAASAWDATPAVDTTDTVSFVSGERALFGYSSTIADVKPIESRFRDSKKRTFERGKASILFSDDSEQASRGPFRVLLEAYPDLLGKIVEIEIGTANLLESEFAPMGVFRIESAKPRSGLIEVFARDAGAILDGANVVVDVVGLHPLEAIELICQAAGVPDALYDATSLDPTQYADIGHWSVSRSFSVNRVAGAQFADAITSGTNAAVLVNQLLELLGGIFQPNESGVYAFRRFDPSSAAQLTITASDHISNFSQVEGLGHDLVNHVSVVGAASGQRSSTLVEFSDRQSQQKYARAGNRPLIKSLNINSQWLGKTSDRFSFIGSASTPPLTCTIRDAGGHGFSGCRFNRNPTPTTTATQGANEDATASRPVYLLFYNDDGDWEMMRAENVEADDSVIIGSQAVQQYGSSSLFLFYQFTIEARALFGSTARAWDVAGGGNGVYVADATIAVDVAQRTLSRLAHGAPEVEFDLPFWLYSIQVGDKFGLIHNEYIDHAQSGADGSVRFEAIQKKAKPRGPGAGIRIRAKYAETVAARIPLQTPTDPIIPPPILPTDPRYFSVASLQFDGTDDFVDLGSVDTLDGVAAFTFQCWYRSIGALPSNGVLLSRNDGGSEQIQIEIQSGEIHVDLDNGTYTATTTGTPLTANTWHHIAVTFIGSSAVRIYVDGVNETITDSGSLMATMSTGGGSNMRIGAHSDTPDGTYHSGRIDNAALFTVAADPNEVGGELYSSIAVADLSRLSFGAPAHWWPFDNSYADRVGTAHGTPSGNPHFFGDHAP